MKPGHERNRREREALQACEQLMEPVSRAMAIKLHDILLESERYASQLEQARCVKAAEDAATEWFKSIEARDKGLPAVDFGPLADHIINKVRAPHQAPADQPSR